MSTHALKYHEWGWLVIPIPHQSKFPAGEWRRYQQQRAGRHEVESWYRDKDQGVGVVCGSISNNLVCLDFDENDAYAQWEKDNPDLAKQLPTAMSARGVHVFFRTETPMRSAKFRLREKSLSPGERLGEGSTASQSPTSPGNSEAFNPHPALSPRERVPGKPVGDLISEGKLVVLPPTIHPSGVQRKWLVKPYQELPTLPLQQAGVEVHTHYDLVKTEQPTIGNRHDTMLAIATSLRQTGIPPVALLDTMLAYNKARCNPPLPRFEVEGIYNWIINSPSYRGGSGEESMVLIGNERRFERLGYEKPIHPDDLPHMCLVRRTRDEQQMATAFQNAKDYVTEQGDESFEWIVEGMLPKGYLVVLGGTSKAGKSCFVTSMSMAVAEGKPFLGYDVTQGSVLWCAYEESRPERADGLRAYAEISENLFITHEKPMIDQPNGLDLLRFWIEKTQASLIVVDPLYGSNSAESLTDGRSARNALQGLKDLCSEMNCSAIVIHHITKNVHAGMTRERFADSNQILATASMDILMSGEEMPDGTRQLRLSGRGRGGFANQTWLVKSASPSDFELIAVGTTAEIASMTESDSIILKTLEDMGGGMTADEIAGKTKVALATVRNRLTDLVRQGKVVIQGKRGRSNSYVAVQPGLQDQAA